MDYSFNPESIHYLDVLRVLPETFQPGLRDSFNALLVPLLVNSALAAIRAQPQSSVNAMIATANTTRALDNLEPNNADRGMDCGFTEKRSVEAHLVSDKKEEVALMAITCLISNKLDRDF